MQSHRTTMREPAATRRVTRAGLALIAIGATIGACARNPHPILHSTAWVRTAPEYDAVAREAFRLAMDRLPEALEHPFWTAAIEQTGGYQELPPAVIVDIDETVLDNTPFQVRMINEGEEFDAEAWAAWVEEAAALPVPGALDFARAAERRGIEIFYVTNRDQPQEAATRRNLQAAGFPLGASGQDRVLSRGERREWTSDKSSRRAAVARRYRILLLIGDDLNDFVSARLSPAERDSLAARYEDRWGRQWIMIPNPLYGSWEDALYGFQSGVSPDEKTRRKADALD
ncbi:MAG TPA: HAD family acid phosphatase [Gemmatimonadota bacterium]|jgi:acid phosphatase|nr:HAD family acid phosphatase [Gemmatimonadota bacterium]